MKGALLLIGQKASGKSFLARKLSKKLCCPFFDGDVLVAQEYVQKYAYESVKDRQIDLKEAHAFLGAEKFNFLQYQKLYEKCTDFALLAAGGGLITCQEARKFLEDYPWVILVNTPWQTCFSRIRSLGGKYLGSEDEKLWQATFESRRPLYEAVAKFHLTETNMPALSGFIQKWKEAWQQD